MKKRTLLTNIFIVILMISIVFVLLAFFDVFNKDTLKNPVLTVSMIVALVSVSLIDIFFPIIDNFSRFKSETGYKVKSIVKFILFGLSVVFLVLTVKGTGFFAEEFLGIALFCIAYLAQFFIDLDKAKKENIEDYDSSKDESDDEDELEDADEVEEEEIEEAEETEVKKEEDDN